jgi:anaerobic ribonucleoside-triphosphate reductase activating protein
MKFDETFLPIGFLPPESPPADALRVADLQHRSWAAGPGVRSVVWVAGCHRRCPGCLKPEWFDFSAGRLMPVGQLVEMLDSVEETSGVTFSGGEPFEQAPAMATLARLVRATGRNVLVYTGYRHEFLRDSGTEAHRDLLAVTDILIDGEYRAELGGAGAWRGSINQRVLALSADGSRVLEAEAANGTPRNDVQVVIDGGGLRVTGCPAPGFMRRLTEQLASRGVVLGGSGGDGHDD